MNNEYPIKMLNVRKKIQVKSYVTQYDFLQIFFIQSHFSLSVLIQYAEVNICFSFQGHEKEALNLMSTYLPKDSSPGSAYSEGGGLFALGNVP